LTFFSIIGGEGNERFVGFGLAYPNRGLISDVSEKRGQQIMAGRIYFVPDPDTRVWWSVLVRAGK
jgi:hypothetical protein